MCQIPVFKEIESDEAKSKIFEIDNLLKSTSDNAAINEIYYKVTDNKSNQSVFYMVGDSDILLVELVSNEEISKVETLIQQNELVRKKPRLAIIDQLNDIMSWNNPTIINATDTIDPDTEFAVVNQGYDIYLKYSGDGGSSIVKELNSALTGIGIKKFQVKINGVNSPRESEHYYLIQIKNNPESLSVIQGFVSELSTWLTFSEEELKQLELISDKNKELVGLISDWKSGVYDEDMHSLKYELLNILPKPIKSYREPTGKIAGLYEVLIPSYSKTKMKNNVAGFEREDDSHDSLYLMDDDKLKNKYGSFIIKNSDMNKFEKGVIVTGITSFNGAIVKLKRLGSIQLLPVNG